MVLLSQGNSIKVIHMNRHPLEAFGSPVGSPALFEHFQRMPAGIAIMQVLEYPFFCIVFGEGLILFHQVCQVGAGRTAAGMVFEHPIVKGQGVKASVFCT